MADSRSALSALLANARAFAEVEFSKRIEAEAPRHIIDLAVAPEWSASMAEALGVGDRKWLDSLVDAGVLEKRSSVGDAHVHWSAVEPEAGHALYWLPESRRGQVQRQLTGDDPDVFTRQAALIARRLLHQESEAVPATTKRWAQLASKLDQPADLIRWLDEETTRLLAAADALVSSSVIGELFDLVTTARSLEWLASLDVTTAIERSARRLQLYVRRKDERASIRSTLKRPELEEPLWDLLDTDDGAWALHYLGSGGVGKTVFARQLCVELVPSRGGATARVDFDHLDPAYPARDPGLLLVSLAEELQLYDAARKTDAAADKLIEASAEAMESLSEHPRRLHRKLDSPEMDSALTAFADIVGALPAPVVLVLDTCEELARLRAADGSCVAVDATFQLLGEIYRRSDHKVRVVLLGRRLLCDVGHDWWRTEVDPNEGGLRRRDELRLCPVFPWRRQDAERWLDSAAERSIGPHCDRLREPAWRAALLTMVSKGAASAIDVTWADGRQFEPGRVGPFDLVNCARWVADEEGLQPEMLEGADDRYVALRIVGRLGPSARALLPAATVLGRFDKELLQDVATKAGQVPPVWEGAFEDLAGNEWISREAAGGCAIQSDWWPRLAAFMVGGSPGAMKAAREAAREVLRARLDDRPADAWTIDTLLRLLEPAEGGRVWGTIESQTVAAADWARLERVAGVVAASTGRCRAPVQGEAPHPLRAAVLAALAGARLHLYPRDDAEPVWLEVEKLASTHPDPVGGERLSLIAAACRRPERWEHHPLALPGAGLDAPDDTDQQLFAALIAGAEWILDRCEEAGVAAPPILAQRLEALYGTGTEASVPLELRVWLRILQGRARMLAADRSGGLDMLDAAVQLMLAMVQNGYHRSPYLFWRSPPDLTARVRVEWLRHHWPAYSDAAAMLRWTLRNVEPSSPAFVPKDRDEDAMVAIAAELRRALRKGHRRPLAEPAAYLDLFTAEGDTPAAWRSQRPALLIQAEEAALQGDADSIHWLEEIASQSWQRAEALTIQRQADAARHRVALAHRAWDFGGVQSEGLLAGGTSSDVGLVWAAQAIFGQLGVPPMLARSMSEGAAMVDDPMLRVLRWRATAPVGVASVRKVLAWAAKNLLEPQTIREDASARPMLILARLDANRLAGRYRLKPPFPQEDGSAVAAWIEAHPEQPRVAIELQLLGWAHGLWSEAPGLEQTVGRLGVRAAAWRARALGELIALRLPADGALLLGWAAQRFDACDDRLSATTSRIALACQYADLRRTDELRDIVTSLVGDPSGAGALERLRDHGIDSEVTLGWRNRCHALIALLQDGGRPGDACVVVTREFQAVPGFSGLPSELRWLDRTPEDEPELAPIAHSFVAAPESVARRDTLKGPRRSVIEVSADITDRSLRQDRPAVVRWSHRKREGAFGTIRVPMLVSPRASRASWGPELASWSIGRGECELRVQGGAEALPWEAMLAIEMLQRSGKSPRGLKLQVARTPRRLRRRPSSRSPDRPWGRVAIASGEDLRIARDLYGAWDMGGAVDVTEFEHRAPPPDVQIAHILCRASRSSRGLSLQLGSGGKARRATKSSYRRSARDLDLETAVRLLHSTALVILQPPLLRDGWVLGSTHRLESALLRMVAVALCQRGVRRVLVLPWLTEFAMLSVVTALARAVVEPEPGDANERARIHRGLDAARGHIYDWEGQASRALLDEVAFEASLTVSG